MWQGKELNIARSFDVAITDTHPLTPLVSGALYMLHDDVMLTTTVALSSNRFQVLVVLYLEPEIVAVCTRMRNYLNEYWSTDIRKNVIKTS